MVIVEILQEADFEAFFTGRASEAQEKLVREFLSENPRDAAWLARKFRKQPDRELQS